MVTIIIGLKMSDEIDHLPHHLGFEREQAEKGISPYYSDLPLVTFCAANGFPIHTHPYFRGIHKRWPNVICEVRDARVMAVPNVGTMFYARGFEEHLFFDCLTATGFKSASLMAENPPQQSFYPYDSFSGDAAVLIGSAVAFGDDVNSKFTRFMYADLFSEMKEMPIITRPGMVASSYELIGLLGMPKEQVIQLPDYQIIDCERLFVPSILAGLSAEADNYHFPSEAAQWLRNRISEACGQTDEISPTTPTRKVYLSRESAKQRETSNEDEVIEVVRSYGYEIIDPADYSICEQVKIARETKQFISLTGSQTTTIQFAQPGTRFLELKVAEWMTRRILGYSQIYRHLGIPHTQYLYKEFDDGDYTVDPENLAKAIRQADF